jgi:hypothetical protein
MRLVLALVMVAWQMMAQTLLLGLMALLPAAVLAALAAAS